MKIVESGVKYHNPNLLNIQSIPVVLLLSADVNNLVTIIGGIVTSLFIPVILLLVRNYVRNNRRKGPSADRNPGDGADQLDGKDNDKNDDDDDDDDDDDGKGMS
jgi:hypothetical protein